MVYHVKGKIFRNEPLSFFLEDGEIEERISPYYMARIVDLKEFLRHYPFTSQANKPLTLSVSDPILEWNTGTFTLSFSGEQTITEDQSAQAIDVQTDIQTLVTLLLNYKRAKDLKAIGRIEASDETIAYLEAIIPDNHPWFSDYF